MIGEWAMKSGCITRVAGVMLAILLAVSAALCEQITWTCPECGRTGNTGKFCGSCAHASPAPTPVSTPVPTPKPGEAGSIVRFGHYEQDNKSSTGKEDIEWIVLDVDKKNRKALLLSRYVLATQSYYTMFSSASWEKSKIRKWLNNTFFDDAFNSKERKAILNTRLNNGFNQQRFDESKYSEKGGNTTDKLFLLSYKEANKYFGKMKDRAAKATPQALARDTWTVSKGEYKGNAVWLLRSTGSTTDAVDLDGDWTGVRVDMPGAGIRPALWVSTSSGVLK